jgi:hypothetical protein
LVVYHSLSHSHPRHGDIDLHWRLLQQCCTSAADRHFWSGSRTLAVKDLTTRQPAPADMLFHAVMHGMRPNPEPPIRWVADAVTVMRSSRTIDWERLVDFAERQKLTHRLGIGLQFLAREMAAPVPQSVLRRLDGRRAPLFERLETEVMFGGRTADPPMSAMKVRIAGWGRLMASYEWRAVRETGLMGLRRRSGQLGRLLQTDR